MRELGLTLARVPSTFGVWVLPRLEESIPQYVFDTNTILMPLHRPLVLQSPCI
jgi:hypothetical protein